jgi:hypothetical protein
MSQYTPQVGQAGLYTLLPPFDTQLVASTPYACIAVRKLTDIIAAGGDPFAEYYEPNQLDDAAFQADVAADACIVSLQAGGHTVVYVPTTYIAGAPNIGGVPYTVMALGISLGAIPDSLDLTYIKGKIQADVLENLGVDAEVHAMAISLPTLLTHDQAKAAEIARQAKKGTVVTDYAKYLKEKDLRESAELRIQQLEAFIRDNHMVAPP